MLRRRWALTALRKNARLKLERLQFVSRGIATAAARRLNATVGNEARARRGVRVPPRSACGFAPLSAHAHMMRIPDALTVP